MTNPNDPAFEPLIWKQMPLTKREFMATMAMQGFASYLQPSQFNVHDVAKGAVAWADALLAELSK